MLVLFVLLAPLAVALLGGDEPLVISLDHLLGGERFGEPLPRLGERLLELEDAGPLHAQLLPQALASLPVPPLEGGGALQLESVDERLTRIEAGSSGQVLLQRPIGDLLPIASLAQLGVRACQLGLCLGSRGTPDRLDGSMRIARHAVRPR